MDKLQMAHEYALVRLTTSNPKTLDEIIRLSWYYADAMQKEADSRKPKGLPDVFKKDKEGGCLHTHTTYGGGECFDCGNFLNSTNSSQLEWQPDWSQAPSLATHWSMTDYGTAKWHSISTKPLRDCGCAFGVENSLEWSAPTFGYEGDWKDSLRERP